MIKKTIFSVMALTLLTNISVFAKEIKAAEKPQPYQTHVYASQGQSFSKAWSKTAGGADWSINYGYNRFAINEDFTHTKNNVQSCIAEVKNGNGTYNRSATKGNWAKIEVVHKAPSSGYITYSIIY